MIILALLSHKPRFSMIHPFFFSVLVRIPDAGCPRLLPRGSAAVDRRQRLGGTAQTSTVRATGPRSQPQRGAPKYPRHAGEALPFALHIPMHPVVPPPPPAQPPSVRFPTALTTIHTHTRARAHHPHTHTHTIPHQLSTTSQPPPLHSSPPRLQIDDMGYRFVLRRDIAAAPSDGRGLPPPRRLAPVCLFDYC